MKKRDKKDEKLFGMTKDELKMVTGGGGVIIQSPRESAADIAAKP